MMAEFGETPPMPSAPGDYQPGQVEATAGFLNAFESAGLPHGFSPAGSEHSFATGLDLSRPNTSGMPTGAGPPPLGDLPLGPHGPGQISPDGGHHHHHHHHHGSGHSHSFSTASLPSLASSSTSFSLASQGDHPIPPPGMYMPGLPPGDYSPGPMFHDGGKPFAYGPPPQMIPPGVPMPPGMGVPIGMGMPHHSLVNTMPPGLIGRSPVAPPMAVLPAQQMPVSGKMGHDRHRSASRSAPYHMSSRSNSLSVKSDMDEELMSIYSSASNTSGYGTSWSNSTSLIAGDMGQMTLEHRRSSSTPFEIPSNVHHSGRSRARSFSLGKISNSLDFLETELEVSGHAAERETAVRTDLSNKAEQVRSLSPCQHGKARAVWAKRWLKLCYTPVNGFTVPRQGLYHSYTMSCNDFGLRPINSASFGKVVRSTFQGIRTRRLGVRGNSKYHYVSLRPAISTEAHRLNAYGDSSGQLHIAPQDGDLIDDHGDQQEILTDDDTDEEDEDDLADLSEGMQYSVASVHPFVRARHLGAGGARAHSAPDDSGILRSARPAYLGPQDASTPTGVHAGTATAGLGLTALDRPFPPFPAVPAGADPAVSQFYGRFVSQQELLSRCVIDSDFDAFEANYRSFWESLTSETLQLCSQQPLAGMIVEGMALSFDHFILSFVDKILQPLTTIAHSSLGLLAANLEKVTADALGGVSEEVSGPAVKLAGHTANLIARFLDLHQITTAITPILADGDQLAAMRGSWRMFDTEFIVRQCSLSFGNADSRILGPILNSFGNWLNDVGMDMAANPIDQLAFCVDAALARAESTTTGRRSILSLIPRTAYLSSQVMRLLTLRSDPAFGWFQLIKTWIDDYVSIACLRRAAFARSSPIVRDARASSKPSSTSSSTLFSSTPLEATSSHHGHPNPNLAIDTASAHYQAVLPLDGNAITPRPAFTSSGATVPSAGQALTEATVNGSSFV